MHTTMTIITQAWVPSLLLLVAIAPPAVTAGADVMVNVPTFFP